MPRLGLACVAVVLLAAGGYWAFRPGGFNFKSLTALPTASGMAPVTALAFSPDGKLLAEGTADRTVRLLDASTGEERWRISRHDGAVRIWKQGNPMPAYTLRAHGAPVRSVVFSPNEESLAAAYGDGTLALWHTADGEPVVTLEGPGRPADQTALSANGSRLAAGGADGAVKMWKCE